MSAAEGETRGNVRAGAPDPGHTCDSDCFIETNTDIEWHTVDDETRVPVNGMRGYTIAWWEHEAAWRKYSTRHAQDAERVAERGGFGMTELIAYLGHGPTTIQPADMGWIERERIAVAGRKPRVVGSDG